MKASRWFVLSLVSLALLGGVHARAARALTFTCEAVARSKVPDPAGAPFANRFGNARLGGPQINAAGDIVFFARAKNAPRRLYLYPGAGAASVLAEDGGAEPGGGVFTQFESPSINDAGDVGFFGDLEEGEGVFIHEAGGTMVTVASTGDPVPGGGSVDQIAAVSRINSAGDLAFVATIAGGPPNGVFAYDASTTSLTSVAREGDAALDGRRLCGFVAIGLGGSGAVVVQVSTKLDCSDAAEQEQVGVYRQTGGGMDRVALAGDVTPIAGTTYANFYGPPDSNATDQVLFRASASGIVGLFLFDPAAASTTKLVAIGDAAPLGGTAQTITHPGLTDAGRAGVRMRVKGDAAKHGIYLVGGTDEAVVRKTDPVPAGTLFIAPASYVKIYEEVGVDRSGTRLTYSAKVRNGVQPRGAVGLFRCSAL